MSSNLDLAGLSRTRSRLSKPCNFLPPGIGFSPDKMLQGRLFVYGEWQEQPEFKEPPLFEMPA